MVRPPAIGLSWIFLLACTVLCNHLHAEDEQMAEKTKQCEALKQKMEQSEKGKKEQTSPQTAADEGDKGKNEAGEEGDFDPANCWWMQNGEDAQTVEESTTETTSTTTPIDKNTDKGRYDPGQAYTGGEGSGMKPGNCNGGKKWCVDSSNMGTLSSLNEIRNQMGLPPLPDDHPGYLTPTSGPLKGVPPQKLQMMQLIHDYGVSINAPEEVIRQAVTVAYAESNYNPYKGPDSTSAWGLYQYVGDTWLTESSKLNNGVPMNRNDLSAQIQVEYAALNKRYGDYMASPTYQNNFTFGQYDYRHHHDGSLYSKQSASTDAYYASKANYGAAAYNYASNAANGIYTPGVAAPYNPIKPAAPAGGTTGFPAISITPPVLGAVNPLPAIYNPVISNPGGATLPTPAFAVPFSGVSPIESIQPTSSGNSAPTEAEIKKFCIDVKQPDTLSVNFYKEHKKAVDKTCKKYEIKTGQNTK